jgi:predicted  nucleic acid-binding Zn-ribbon protein
MASATPSRAFAPAVRRSARARRERTARTRAFGDARFWRSDTQKMNALEHELTMQREETLKRAREAREATDALARVEERMMMYKTRCERQEREIFALEKALEEKTNGVETAMAVARRQIKWQETRYEELVKETEALRATVEENKVA